MSEHTVSEQAIETQPPATGAYPVQVSHPSSEGLGVHVAPLLPRTAFLIVLAVGVLVGIVGPILLWLNLSGSRQGLVTQVGLLLVLVGLGLVLIAVPFVLGESVRLDRASSGSVGPRPDVRVDQVRGLTGTRVLALVGVLVLVAGAFLLRPVEAADPTTGGGSSQGGGGRN